MDTTRHTEIDAFADIADRFIELSWNACEITLRFEDARIHYPVAVVAVDRGLGRCLIDITSLGDIHSALSDGRSFVLYARSASATLSSSAMRSDEILNRADRLGLRCRLPERLVVSRQRRGFRAVLAEGMQVEVVLDTRDGSCWRALLCNLSVGGCLLRLAAANAVGLRNRNTRYRLNARFPNGEILEAGSRVRWVHIDNRNDLAYVGVAFDSGWRQEERAVWFYVREIERETVRQSRAYLGLYPLAPSRLFFDETAPTAGDSNGQASL